MSKATKVNVEFEVQVGEDDGIVQIRRWEWAIPISGRGMEHSQMELVGKDEWTIGTREQAFKLATNIMETLAFYSPPQTAEKP